MKYKLLVIDRDNVLCKASADINSPNYYILHKDAVILNEGAFEALQKIKSLGIKTVLATKQRCISKGLITKEEVDNINTHLEEMLNFKFDNIYIEEKSPQKLRVFGQILSDHKDILPSEILVIDDSSDNCVLASILGFSTFETNNISDILNIL